MLWTATQCGCTDLIRPINAILWELRRAWATGTRVALSLTEDAGRRAEGHIRHVSPTGASININGVLIPADRVLAVHRPMQWMGEETTWKPGERFDGLERRRIPQREQLPVPGGWGV